MSNLSPEHIAELWRRMTDIYGHKWSSQHGEIDHDDTWLRGLSDLTPAELSHGLSECAKQEPDQNGITWAPTLPEFRSMCRFKDTRPAYFEEHKGLSAPQISKEDALKHLAAIHESLK